MIHEKSSNGFIISFFRQIKPYKSIKLTTEALRIQNTPNAGGSSVESEALSFEFFKKFFNAELLCTEMEVSYFPQGGSITDYVLTIFGKRIGVSVTRAMKKNFQEYTIEDADILLRKKLKGINQSSKNTLLKWHKQILHVWAFDDNSVDLLLIAWSEIDTHLKSNTVLVVTLATKSQELFVNQKIGKKCLVVN
ncbi:AAC-rich mRNA clone AAC4 -like [Brachionus plicatilis]|uniref:AAC-rich mRNA clone AAC4-like n=1 Tax=Brachionus plicatilis TaxID=10195 RepID=A0A3M7PKF5_BRAPC|nr:AAC-rich mRNA clone AAC4 -like [Brachionus plicatilis]